MKYHRRRGWRRSRKKSAERRSLIRGIVVSIRGCIVFGNLFGVEECAVAVQKLVDFEAEFSLSFSDSGAGNGNVGIVIEEELVVFDGIESGESAEEELVDF